MLHSASVTARIHCLFRQSGEIEQLILRQINPGWHACLNQMQLCLHLLALIDAGLIILGFISVYVLY